MRSDDDEITNLCIYKDRAIKRRPACNAGVPGGFAARNRGADYVKLLAPAPCAGTRNSTEHREPHTSLSKSLDYLNDEYDFEYEWVETEIVEKKRDQLLDSYAGIWSAPGSPFKSLDGALYAITFARLNNIPHFGTCAGFQHAVIELARNLLGIKDAQHEEYDAQSSTLFVNKLVCSLAGKTMDVYLKSGTLAHRLYNLDKTEENYYCNFGINPVFKNALQHPQICISGVDQDQEIRIIELPNHRFFLITLFVPQTRSKPEAPHPLINGFVQAVCEK